MSHRRALQDTVDSGRCIRHYKSLTIKWVKVFVHAVSWKFMDEWICNGSANISYVSYSSVNFIIFFEMGFESSM